MLDRDRRVLVNSRAGSYFFNPTLQLSMSPVGVMTRTDPTANERICTVGSGSAELWRIMFV